MQNFYRKIVNHPRIILTIFVIAALCGAVMQGMVAVNYDMNDYLPAESASTRALELLGEEFEGGIPNARVMVRDVSIADALVYKERFRNVDGVTDVTWLDDVADVHVPLSMLDRDEVETYYCGGCALFTLTIEDEKRVQAVDDLRAIIGDENAMSGAAVSSAVATTSTVTEIRTITVFAVLFVLLVGSRSGVQFQGRQQTQCGAVRVSPTTDFARVTAGGAGTLNSQNLSWMMARLLVRK